ncbi:hypothetical protein BWQ96_09773 [Gracilariopsis chorda]|uniref:Uncharacterized protein n=1 Tax=Gracilariopsis chorda TaxID=448386 RepID=A0A2V3IHB0_9FLOR|nr:hypothetical protein BWQ96_09773 [Gracilariopsis chorda]|eukprot:PXF40520.1 hypothetical protein BWQ96_09773 [Gracilariopsis chorda]
MGIFTLVDNPEQLLRQSTPSELRRRLEIMRLHGSQGGPLHPQGNKSADRHPTKPSQQLPTPTEESESLHDGLMITLKPLLESLVAQEVGRRIAERVNVEMNSRLDLFVHRGASHITNSGVLDGAIATSVSTAVHC